MTVVRTRITEQDLQPVIGLPVNEAVMWLTRHHVPHRTVNVDGHPRIVTRDWNPNRVNLTIEKGIVTDAVFG